MSVDYRAIYGYGFHISNEEVDALPEELHDDFIDSIYTICTDCIYENVGYFFGLNLCTAEPSYMFALPAVDNYDHKDFIAMIKEFKKYFPHRDAMKIKHYLINQVC